MKDDSLSDVQKYYCAKCDTEMNTVICPRCNKLRGYTIPQAKALIVGIKEEDVVALDAAYKYESVLSRKIWNEAIEMAAYECPDSYVQEAIRKLKK